MPTDFEFSEVLLKMQDGREFPLRCILDVVERSTDATSGRGDTAGIAAWPQELNFMLTIDNPHAVRKTAIRLLYGWKSRGPIRKQLLMKLWKKYMIRST